MIGKSRDAFARKFYLERLHALVKDNEEKFYDALAKDLNKPRAEALASEISPVLEECAYFLNVISSHYATEIYSGITIHFCRIMRI
jgi:acyl-CoA reductase-like NAD-dependent aldehyde dehydrogenase